MDKFEPRASHGFILLLGFVAFLLIAQTPDFTGNAVLIKSDCPSGMASYWMMNDASGMNAEDSLGGKNGTLMNSPTWTTGMVNGGLLFDGTNDYVNTSSNVLKTANNFTISLWFKANQTNFAHHLIWEGNNTGTGWSDASGSPSEMHISLGASDSDNDRLSFFLGNSPTSSNTLDAEAVFDDKTQWHHVAAVVSSMSSSPAVSLYLDGVLVDSNTGTTGFTSRATWNSNLTMGRAGSSITPRYFNGSMDEVAIFNRSLSSSDVKELYDKTKYRLDNYCSVFRGSSTINTFYDADARMLAVSGEAPKAAATALLAMVKTTDTGTEYYSDEAAVAPSGMNENAYRFDVDVYTFDEASYNVEVAFFDSGNNEITGYEVSAIFNDLLVEKLDGDLADLEQNVSDIFDQLAAMNGSFSENLSIILARIDVLQGELDGLSGRVDILNDSLNALTVRMDNAEYRLSDLESWLTDLDSRVGAMNHGTINLYYLGPGPFSTLRNKLDVFGEAPMGAVRAEISLYDTQFTWSDFFGGNPPVKSVTVPVWISPPSNQNVYFGTLSTSSLNPVKYNVVVKFYDLPGNLMTGYKVSALFDGLLLSDIADRLDDVEKDLYGDSRNELTNLIRADYCAWKLAKGETGPIYYQYCMSPWRIMNWRNMLQDYGYDDTLYWTMQNLYRDSAQLWNQIDQIWGRLDLLFQETFYGFHDMVFTSRVETYYNPSVSVPITYTIRSNVTLPSAHIGIRDASNGFTQRLRTTYLAADTTYRFTDYVTFSQTGLYNMKMALFQTAGPIYESTNFDVDVVNLADSVPNSTINLTLPNNWGNSFSNPSNPLNDDISWHQPGLIRMEALLGPNTPLTDNSCDVYYYSNRNPSLGRLLLSGLRINKTVDACPNDVGVSVTCQETSSFCADNLLSTMMDQGDEGVYNAEVEQEFISSYDQTDYMRLGIDGTQPIIYRIIPSTGYYSRTLLVQVDAADSLSGIRTVWVSLINKNDSTTYSTEAFFNNDTGYFETAFNTTALEVSDGGYDITVNATDIAGNSVEATVDPSVDNTPPSVSLFDVPTSMCTGKTSTLKAIVVDLLSGVCSKNAALTLPNDSIIDLSFTGDNLYYTPATNLSGFHNLTITASDCAIVPNNMTNVSEYNISVVDCPVPAVPEAPSSKGGSSGSGCYSRISCGEWSDCINGQQTKTCIDYVCHIVPDDVQTKECAVFVEEAAPAAQPETAPAPVPAPILEAKGPMITLPGLILILGILIALYLMNQQYINRLWLKAFGKKKR